MLSIKNLSLTIDTKPLVHSVSLSCMPGSVHIIMGPNGSGKSSLVGALVGSPHIHIHSGEVEFKHENLLALPIEKRARLGLFAAFQYPCEIPGVPLATFLFEAYRSIKKDILSRDEFNTLLQKALHEVHLSPDFASRCLNEGFSGGEKKRLELVQMLILQPDCIILDELDSGLDADGITCMEHVLASLKKNNPYLITIIITHYAHSALHMNPDFVHIMCNGRLVKTGDHSLITHIQHQGYHEFSI